jgi:N-acetylneuraminic acid mutarotase
MTQRDELDLQLTRYFDELADGGSPDALLAVVLRSTRRRLSRPAWAVALLGGGMGSTVRVAGLPLRRLAYVLTLAGLLLALVALLILGTAGHRPIASRCDATWCATGSMATAREEFTATLLANGQVIVAGGRDSGGTHALSSAELYDPNTGAWTATGSMVTARGLQTATSLCDGRVLVAGGQSPDDAQTLRSAELYDPTTGTWTPTGSMGTARVYHRAVRLRDCRVLVVGGASPSAFLSSAELYDPRTGTWTGTGSMTTAGADTATLLADGRVLVAAGRDPGDATHHLLSELYDPTTGAWVPTGNLDTARNQSSAAALLLGGDVLLVGGGHPGPMVSSAELYDPTVGTWRRTGSMHGPRGNFGLVLLTDGRVLVVGGQPSDSEPPIATAELYEPTTGTWRPIDSLPATRLGSVALRLTDGRVLVVGGVDTSQKALASAVISGLGLDH